MSTMRPRRKFTPEFKAEAVGMVDAAGGKIAQVAKEPGIAESTLGRWVLVAKEPSESSPPIVRPA